MPKGLPKLTEEAIKNLPNGLVRIEDFIGPGRMLPIGKSTWWSGVKSGRFPKPVKIGRMAFWRVEDLKTLMDNLK